MPHRAHLSGVVTAAALQRLGYYGIRAGLLIYLTDKLGVPDHLAGQVYGLFYGSLSLTSLVGGLLGDTRLGYRFVGALGLLLIFASHLCLAFGEVPGAVTALVLYSIGFGLFDPNMNAVVARIYRTDRDLRDAAYTILYSGINLGAMLGPVVCGYVALQINPRYGFLVGGLASLIGLLLFATVKSEDKDEPASDASAASVSIPKEKTDTSLAGRPFIVIGGLAVLAIIFWAVFDQLGSSVTLLVQRHVDRNVGSFEVPAGYVQSINPFLVVLLGPSLSLAFKRRASSSKRPRNMELLLSGLILLGVGFGLLALGSRGVGGQGTQATVGWLWILSTILLSTVGELLFAPASTSMVAGLSPEKRRAFIMGAWSATFGVGAYLSGTMSGLMSAFDNLQVFFAISAGACWLTALAFIVGVRFMRR
ncbi:MAG TPA: MFS transporter [Pyrinomonadaceae bacterium]